MAWALARCTGSPSSRTAASACKRRPARARPSACCCAAPALRHRSTGRPGAGAGRRGGLAPLTQARANAPGRWAASRARPVDGPASTAAGMAATRAAAAPARPADRRAGPDRRAVAAARSARAPPGPAARRSLSAPLRTICTPGLNPDLRRPRPKSLRRRPGGLPQKLRGGRFGRRQPHRGSNETATGERPGRRPPPCARPCARQARAGRCPGATGLGSADAPRNAAGRLDPVDPDRLGARHHLVRAGGAGRRGRC